MKAKLGSGSRFAAVEAKAKASGASDPGAVAAVAGRKAHGEKEMEKWAKHGKKKRSRPKLADYVRHGA
jgi:hypothetical protein